MGESSKPDWLSMPYGPISLFPVPAVTLDSQNPSLCPKLVSLLYTAVRGLTLLVRFVTQIVTSIRIIVPRLCTLHNNLYIILSCYLHSTSPGLKCLYGWNKHSDLALQVGRVAKLEAIKYARGSHGTQISETLRWRCPAKNWKVQTRLLVREGAPHQQTRNCLKLIKERRGKIGWSQMGAWHKEGLTDWELGVGCRPHDLKSFNCIQALNVCSRIETYKTIQKKQGLKRGSLQSGGWTQLKIWRQWASETGDESHRMGANGM
jgi:hypothetical protein